MLQIQIPSQNINLDLFHDTSLSIVMESPVYIGGDSDLPIQGAYSFAFPLPNTPTNRRALGDAHRIESTAAPVSLDCIIAAQAQPKSAGMSLFGGTLHVVEFTGRDYSVEIVINGLSGIRDIPMSEMDLGGIQTLNVSEGIQRATQSCLFPDAHDAIHYPVWNPAFASETVHFGETAFQNAWSMDSQSVGNGFLTPHLKVHALLRRFFAALGYTLQDAFFTSRELRWLTLYSNAAMNHCSETGLGDLMAYFAFNRSFPKTPANEYLRHLLRRLGAVMIISHFDKTVRIMPFSDVQAAKTVRDWSSKAVNTDSAVRYRFSEDSIRTYADAEPPSILPEKVYGFSFFREDATAPIPLRADLHEGIYGDATYRYYWKRNVVSTHPTYYDANRKVLYRVLLGRGNQNEYLEPLAKGEYESPFTQALHAHVPMDIRTLWDDPVPTTWTPMPACMVKGNTPRTNAADWADNPNILLFYRGFQNGMPLATTERTGFRGVPFQMGATGLSVAHGMDFTPYDAMHQVDWRNGDGAMELGLKANLDWLASKPKTYTGEFALTLMDLRSFQMTDAIFFRGQLWLVKKLSLNLSKSRGLSLAQVELIRLPI
jgi:hypothetical protein